MDYEVLSIPASRPDGKARKHNWAVVLLYFICLGFIGFAFAISCFILFVSGLVIELLAFLGLLVIAFASLTYGRIQRTRIHFLQWQAPH